MKEKLIQMGDRVVLGDRIPLKRDWVLENPYGHPNCVSVTGPRINQRRRDEKIKMGEKGITRKKTYRKWQRKWGRIARATAAVEAENQNPMEE